MAKKLIIFDFDDTLTDNSKRDIQSFIHIIRKFNLALDYQVGQKIVQWRRAGMVSNSIIKKLIDADDKILFKKCVKQRLNFLENYDSYTKYVQLKHTTIRILSELNNQNHIIVLNSIQSDYQKFQKILTYFKINDFFQKIFINQLSTTKNSMEDIIQLKELLYEKIISEFNFINNKKNVLVIGNLLSDIIPAKNLNLKSLMIEGSFGFDNSMDYSCTQINELKQILEFV
jgi:phosphoglycolate phosphatase-like HAD superfamily hydrolase